MTDPAGGTTPAGTAAPRREDRARLGRRAAAWLRAHPGMVVVLAVPPVLFLAPLVVGRVFLDGDNFLQNFPLRVLVGHDLRHGSLPLLDPYLFSGTPLLGGFNAGAAYPATWVLAFVPRFAGWSLGLAATYDLAALGTYLFLRRQSLPSTPATFGAATFAFAGYMSGQILHVDLIQAAAWLPWTLLAVDALLPASPSDPRAGFHRPQSARASARWAALLALVVGLTALTGGTEVVIDGLLGVLVYAVWQLVTQGRRGVAGRIVARSAAWVAGGLVGGLALGAAQLVPGFVFHSQSQRAGASYAFFTTGSLDFHLLPLLVSPFLLGTDQSTPSLFVGQYNLAEATDYMGILALVATCVLWCRRFRRRPEARAWRVWYALAALGLLSALGGATPFGHLLFLVPVVNDERLLNRNLLLVDFAMAVLLAWWLRALLDRPAPAPSPSSAPPAASRRGVASVIGWRPGRRAEILLTAAPATLMVVSAAALWIDGPLLLRLLDAMGGLTPTARYELAGLVTLGAAIGVTGTVLVLVESRLTLATLRRSLAAVLAVDLVVLTVFLLHVPIPERTAQAQTPPARALARLTAGGRFLVYDPDEFSRDDLYALGQTDLNLFPGTPSGQGYAALTDGAYYQATGAHLQEDLDPASLRGPVWDDLDATALLSLPVYFVTPTGSGPPAGSPLQFPPTPGAAVRDYTGAPLPTDTPLTLAPGASHVWYLGGPLSVSAWSVPVERGSPSDLAASVVTARGGTAGATVRSATGRSVQVAGSGAGIAGVAVRNRSNRTVVVGVPSADAAETGPVTLDGRMQYGVDASHWRYVGTLGPFGAFVNLRARGWAWTSGPVGGSPAAGTAVTAGPPAADGSQSIGVRAAAPVDLVRSMSWTPGWQASARPVGANHATAARSLVVRADGIVQQVALPAGDWTVTFSYRPASATAGIVVSAVVVALLLAGAVVDVVLVVRARRRRTGGTG